jgi:hypothetical protein
MKKALTFFNNVSPKKLNGVFTLRANTGVKEEKEFIYKSISTIFFLNFFNR